MGKSTLLSSWAAGLSHVHVAWVNCRPEHNDPVVLAAQIRAAFSPGLAVPARAPLGGMFDGLGGARQGSPVLLILDDAHELRSSQVLAALDRLIAARPPLISLVVSGREDLDLAWHKIRLQGVVELRGPHLAFEVAEARRLLSRTYGAVLPEEQVAELCRLSEGWAAGLCLAGLALRDSALPLSKDGSELGHHPYVRSFLESEVLDLLPDDQVRFLETSSLLDVLDPELCDILTERTDSVDLLERFVDRNLFTDRVSQSPVRFKYHALFAEFLRSRFERSRHSERGHLMAAASQWYEANGVMDAAITASIGAGDTERAENLIRSACGPAMRAGMAATVSRWVRSLPAETIEGSPQLGLVLARASVSRGDLLMARTALGSLNDHCERHPAPGLKLGILHLDFLVKVLEVDLGAARDLIEEANQILVADPEQPELPIFGIDEEALCVYRGLARLLTGDLDLAAASTDQAFTPARLSYPTKATVLGLGVRALALAWADDEPAAADCLRAGRDAVSSFQGSTGDPLAFHLAAAWVSNGEEGDHGLASARAIVDELGFPLYRLVLQLTETRHALRGGRAAAASDELDKADDLITSVANAAYLGKLAERLRIELDSGRARGTGEELNAREVEILARIAAGDSRREAAQNLHLSLNTVKTYLRTAYQKLGTSDRPEAVSRARELGLIISSDTSSDS